MRRKLTRTGLAAVTGVAVVAGLLVALIGLRERWTGTAATVALPLLSDPRETASLADGPGVVNFWASWCVACRTEHPLLMRLGGAGVAVYGVNHRDQREDALRWLEFFGDPYRHSLFDGDGALGDALDVDALPVTLVVDPGGRIVYTHLGPLDQGIIDTEIRPLLESGRLK